MNEQIDYAKEYDNSGRVANAGDLIEKYKSDAATFRRTHPMVAEYDQPYGSELRNRMDIFWPHTEAGKNQESPIVMFIHGGYWKSMDRSSFSHMATGLLAHDIAVAMPSYTLCPETTIDGIIVEIQRACLVLFQKFQRSITVVGHSAGGHLAACMRATDWTSLNSSLPDNLVASGMGISGIYDLMPLLQTPVNNTVRMNAEAAISASPVKWVPSGTSQFEAWVGSDESDEYHRQSRELADRWSLLGTPTNYVSEPGQNHFTVIDALTDSKSAMVNRIVELVEDPEGAIDVPMPTRHALQKALKAFERENGVSPSSEQVPKKESKSKSVAKKPTKRKPRKKKTASGSSTDQKADTSKKKPTDQSKKPDQSDQTETTPQEKT